MAITKSPQEERREEELMQDVLLLLNHLASNEQTTIKLILDCLYEVGALNLINQRFSQQKYNRVMRAIATLSKPAFKIVALKWFNHNCPQLIVDWLHSQVRFSPPPPEAVATTPTTDKALEQTPPPSPKQNQELQRLQVKVKVLTGLCISSMSILGALAIWQMYNVGRSDIQPLTPTATLHQTKPIANDLPYPFYGKALK